MALVPIIQPPIMRALTTEAERKIRMKSLRKVGRLEKLIFALVVTIFCILLVPDVSALIGMLMLGNFIRECGVCERLSKAAQNETINIVTVFLGTSVGITMTGDRFIRVDTNRFCRRFSRSDGRARIAGRGREGRSRKLPADARDGAERRGRHRHGDGRGIFHSDSRKPIAGLAAKSDGAPRAVLFCAVISTNYAIEK